MTAAATKRAERTIDTKHATVVIVARPDGWTITGTSKLRFVHTATDSKPAEFTAEIARCECDPEHPDAATYKGTRQTPCKCKRSHRGFCHGWHLERVEELAEKISRSYL